VKKIIIALCLLGFYNISLSSPDSQKANKIDALMNVYYEEGLFDGTVLVAHKGEVIYKKAFGLANREWMLR
jgi:CubicO group peptidase (beta-lactamase class C family)